MKINLLFLFSSLYWFFLVFLQFLMRFLCRGTIGFYVDPYLSGWAGMCWKRSLFTCQLKGLLQGFGSRSRATDRQINWFERDKDYSVMADHEAWISFVWLDFGSEHYFWKKIAGLSWLSLTDKLQPLTLWIAPTFLKLALCNYFAIIKGLMGHKTRKGHIRLCVPPRINLHVGSITHRDWSFPSSPFGEKNASFLVLFLFLCNGMREQ